MGRNLQAVQCPHPSPARGAGGHPAPPPRPAAGRPPRAGVRLLLPWGPCMQWRILRSHWDCCALVGLPRALTPGPSHSGPGSGPCRWQCTGRVAGRRRPPRRAGRQSQPGGTLSAPCPVTILPPGWEGAAGTEPGARDPAEGLAVASPSAPLGSGPLGPWDFPFFPAASEQSDEAPSYVADRGEQRPRA